LKTRPELRVRMGIHSGPVSGIIDVNGQINIAGGTFAAIMLEPPDFGREDERKRIPSLRPKKQKPSPVSWRGLC